MQADYVEVEGTRVLVRRFGEGGGHSVFYWHGAGGSSDELPRIAPALTDAGYPVYAPDAPGYGDSPRLRPEEYLASNIAQIGVAMIDELALSPVIWVGFSWGASIGIHAAVRHRDRFKALVLLDGGYFVPEDDPDYDPSLDMDARIAALAAELDPAESWDAPVEVMAAAVKGSNDDPAPVVLPALEAAGLPVLLVAATQSPKHATARARALARFRAALPSAEIVSVAAGHGVLQEAGDDVRRILLRWLEGLG